MKGVKWYLMHYHLITFFIELIMNNLVAPLIFLPSTAAYCNGFLLDMGVPFKVAMFLCDISFLALPLSMLMIFENRHSQILTISYRMTRTTTKIIFYTCHYLIFPAFLSLYYFQDVNQSLAKLEFLESVPCPEPHFFDDRTQVLTTRTEVYAVISGISVLYFTIIIQFFAIQSGYHLLKRPAAYVSDVMKQMQRKFFFILLIQIAIPVLFMLIPNIIFYSVGETDQFVSTMTVIFVSLHGLSSSLALVLLHKPYRDFTWDQSIGRCFKSSRKKSSDRSVRPNTVTMF
uniref:Serpentine Receptor, class H n=1 Tax=Caenorhabditis tropicalis TaxID=1561998 RepID=A0A1I7U1L6_9PELO